MPEHPESSGVHMQPATCFFEVAVHKAVYVPCNENSDQANEKYEQKRTEVA